MDTRKEIVKTGELVVAIEGKTTNFRLWSGGESLYARLDKANSYSVPIHEGVHKYTTTEKGKKLVKALENFEFPTHINNLEGILEIVKDCKERDLIEW